MFSLLQFVLVVCLSSAAMGQGAPTSTLPESSSATVTTSSQPTTLPEYKTFEEAFREGVAAAEKKAFDQAILAFKKALEFNPDDAATLLNLSVSYWERGEKIQALAASSRALEFNPGDSVLRTTVEFYKKNTQIRDIPHAISTYESFRTQFLSPLSLDVLLFVTALLFVLSGLAVLRLLKARKLMKESGETPQQVGVMPFLTSALFVLGLILVVLKIVDMQSIRAMVLEDSVVAYSAPNSQAATLLTLNAGLGVEVGQIQGDWIQVTYPGAGGGWVEKTKLYPISRGVKW